MRTIIMVSSVAVALSAAGWALADSHVLRAGTEVCSTLAGADCHVLPIDVPVEIVQRTNGHALLRALRPGNTSAEGWVVTDKVLKGLPADCETFALMGVADKDCDSRK